MTRDYEKAEATYKTVERLPADYNLPPKSIPANFPIEHARLRRLPLVSTIFGISTAAYGFSLAFPAVTSLRGWIAVPLILQFLIASTSNAVFAMNQTLVSDISPGKGASSTALNNLVRCGLGAVGVALIDMMIAGFGPASTFLGLALLMLACMPLAVMNWYWGIEWRAARINKRSQREAHAMKE
jgi:hypothetical protein